MKLQDTGNSFCDLIECADFRFRMDHSQNVGTCELPKSGRIQYMVSVGEWRRGDCVGDGWPCFSSAVLIKIVLPAMDRRLRRRRIHYDEAGRAVTLRSRLMIGAVLYEGRGETTHLISIFLATGFIIHSSSVLKSQIPDDKPIQ